MSVGTRSEVGFAATLQVDLSIFMPGIMPVGEVIERADGSRLRVHFLAEIPPGEVFKTRRGNTIARAGHGRVVLLGGLHELDASRFVEEAAAAGPSVAESLPGAIWSDAPRQLEHAKQFLAEARRAQAAAVAETSPLAQRAEHARALRLYEAAHMLSSRPGHLHCGGWSRQPVVPACSRLGGSQWAVLLSTSPSGPHRPSTPPHAPPRPRTPLCVWCVRCAGCTWLRCARASGTWR